MEELETSFNVFESVKHIDEERYEYWYARELQKVLGYKEWRKFNNVIEKAKISCSSNKNEVLNHFVHVDKMIEIAKNAKRKIIDYKLSRYACYLIAQNGDSRVKILYKIASEKGIENFDRFTNARYKGL